MAGDVLVPISICGMLFVGLPWLIFHYVTAWKKNGGLTVEDERLLDDLHDMARKLDDRLVSLERILGDDPTYRPRSSSDRTEDRGWRREN